MFNRLFILFSYFCAEAAEENSPQRFPQAKPLAETQRLFICEFFPEAEQQLLLNSKKEAPSYIALEERHKSEKITELVVRRKLRQQYREEECFMKGNSRLPLLDKDYQVVGLYSFTPPDNAGYCEVIFYISPQYRGLGYMPEAITKINELLLEYMERPTYWPKMKTNLERSKWDALKELTEDQFFDRFDEFYLFKPKQIKGIYAEVALLNKSSLTATLKSNLEPIKPHTGDLWWWGEACFYFPVKKQENSLLRKIIKAIADSPGTSEEEISLTLVQQQIKEFDFIPQEIKDKAIALLQKEGQKTNTLDGIPLCLLLAYRVIIAES